MALPNTHLGAARIGALLDTGDGVPKHLFFAGIGGVSMNALAHISRLRGHRVSGYDRTPSDITKHLEESGISVYYTADAAHMRDVDALVYTVAIGADNPEYAYAQAHGIPCISRADYLGYLMTGYRHRIGVSGTHGKSTTTGMIARILTEAGRDPTVCNGAVMKETGTVDRIGGTDFFVFEACEYMDSFLDFYPTVAVVLNVERDHVDYFPSLAATRASFTAFMNRTNPGESGAGIAVVNADDPNAMEAAAGFTGSCITFGCRNPAATYYADAIKTEKGRASFDICQAGERLCHVRLRVPGKHNISDALAAFAACRACGLTPAEIAPGLCAYAGIVRRMDWMGSTNTGLDIYSDYAHHPTEIEATLAGAAEMGYTRMTVVFQPHTFSRTAALFSDFVRVLAESAADTVVLCDIYAARETNASGVTSQALGDAIAAQGKKCVVMHDLTAAAAWCRAHGKAGEVCLVMGAGDVIQVAEQLTDVQADCR